MTGWEGEITRPGDKKLNSRIHIAGTDPRHQGLQHQITADDLQHKSGHHRRSCLSVLWHEHENSGENDPDQTTVAQRGKGRHQQVQNGIPQVCLYPIQNGKFK